MTPDPDDAKVGSLIDEACDRFEMSWKRGEVPELADFLSDARGEHRARLFRELLHLDLFYHERLGGKPSEGYASQFPDLVHILTDVMKASPSNGTVDHVAPPRDPGDYESLRTDAGTPNRPLSTGIDRIPGYEILDTLGRGGMGVVYKAKQKAAGRTVALKMILGGEHAGEQELDRFRTEAHAIARLRHPGIVQIYEVGEGDGLPFFSMEFCEGGSLERRLAGTPLPGRTAAELVALLAAATHEAHLGGIVHRDLKPSNVLLQRRTRPCESSTSKQAEPVAGESIFELRDFELKLTDFGLAKILDDVSRTQTGAVMGTPSYMAPEQAEGQKDVGPLADVWALGAILYECLTGRPPFKAASIYETIMQVLNDEPVPPRQLVSRLDPDLETIVLKSLAKPLAQRYASAAQLADDLRRYLDGIPVRARPVTRLESLRRWAVRRPAQAALVGVSTLAALILLGGSLYASWAIGSSKSDADLAESRSRGSILEARSQRIAADAANLSSSTARFHSSLRQARERAAAPVPGWSEVALAELKVAIGLEQVAKENRSALGSELANWVLTLDVQPRGVLEVPLSYCSAWRPGRNEVAVGQGRQTGLTPCKIWLMNAETGKMVRELTFVPLIKFRFGEVPRLDGVHSIGFSPDGRWLAAGARNGGVWLWDLDEPGPKGKLLLTLPDRNQTVGFDADGGVLICRDDKALVSWSVTEGKELARRSFPTGRAGPPALDPRGGQLAVSINDRIEFLCTRRLTSVAQPIPHRGFPTFSPDGRTLAVRFGTIVQLFAADGLLTEPIATLRQPNGEQTDDDTITHTLFSPDGSFLLTLSEFSNHARLWEVSSGRLLMPVVVPGEITGAAFAPDGKRFLVQAGNRSLWFAITGGQCQSYVAAGPSPVEAMAYAPNGTLAVQSRSTTHPHSSEVSLWSPDQPPTLRARVERGGMGSSCKPVVAFSPLNDVTFVYASHHLAFWEGASNAFGRRASVGQDIDGLAYAPSGRLWFFNGPVLGVVGENAVRWTNSLLVEKRVATSLVASKAHLISGWRNGTIRIHEADAQPTHSHAPTPSAIRALALTPGHDQVAAGTEAGEVILLRVSDLTAKASASEDDRHRDAVTGLAFFGPKLLLSAGLDGRLSLWEVTEGRLRLALQLRLPRAVRAMAAHPDSRRVAVLLDRERAVRVLDLHGLLTHLSDVRADQETLKLLPDSSPPNSSTPPRIPFAGLDAPSGPNGLRAELFADPWFANRVKVRYDARFAFDWGDGLPDRALPGPAFSVRWTGWLVPPKRGKVKLWAHSVGKAWVRHGKDERAQDYLGTAHTADLELTYEGKPLPIRLDFAKTQPKAAFSLEWSGEGIARKETIPPGVLFYDEREAMKAAEAMKE